MVHIPLLEEIAIVAAAAVLVAVVGGRLRLPTVAGLLLCGAILGPNALAAISDTHAIEVIAEVGVVLLLFTIGLEFSLERIKHIFKRVALGGVLQVFGTFGMVVAVSLALGGQSGSAVFFGFAIALSSTAIVLRALAERRELDAPHGRFIVGTLIFQDLCVVPMVLIVPLLGTGEGGGLQEIGLALGKAAAVVLGVLGCSRLIVPRVMQWIEAVRSREVFLLAVLALCVGTAWLTSLAGLSLALGAFLGGMVVADTEYSHRAMGDMLPLRDVFVSFFFVSLGMFFDLEVLLARPFTVGLLLVGLILGKGLLATLAALAMRFPVRAAWLAGVGLAQFGEFGFVLVQVATRSGVVEHAQVAPLLTAGIISMFLTPLMVQAAPHITAGERLLAPLARLLRARGIEEPGATSEELCDHVVLVGYGVGGRLVASALRSRGIAHVILELNADNVRQGRQQDLAIFYADATSSEALGHARVEAARCAVVMINDPQATQRVVDALRRCAPQLPVVVRTHYLAEHEVLLELGAKQVVVEEIEGGIEVLTQVLRELDVPRNIIESEVTSARSGSLATMRSTRVHRKHWHDNRDIAAMKIESVVIPEGGRAESKTLRELDLRAVTGASIVAVQCGDILHPAPEPDRALAAGDIAYLVGSSEAVASAVDMLGAARAEQDTGS